MRKNLLQWPRQRRQLRQRFQPTLQKKTALLRYESTRFISGLADVGLIRLGLWSLIFGAYIWEKRNEINRRYGFDLNWDGLIWNNEMDFLKRFFDKPSRLRYA